MREGRRMGVALRTARLMSVKTIKSFDFSSQPSLNQHCITATGVAAVRAERSVYRCSLAELI